ncbi:hypothetical protein CDAR_208441 [Caerostris darwini]|uniref:Uncharacterized protein n=1 Tax=Caerostris darwini TaxID=1538125 RepID=A0AAV4VAM4_9ARAC|nr:hypothetical protein CDAR_208441 [Caerostris darwini]
MLLRRKREGEGCVRGVTEGKMGSGTFSLEEEIVAFLFTPNEFPLFDEGDRCPLVLTNAHSAFLLLLDWGAGTFEEGAVRIGDLSHTQTEHSYFFSLFRDKKSIL